MQTIQEIYIDINGTNRYETITAKAQDDEARVIVINFIDNGKILLISNTATARIHIKTSIGTDFLNDCAIIDGKVQVVLKANMLITGTSKCEIMITDVPDNQVITSAYFDLRVSGSLDSFAIEQSSDFSSLREGLKRLDSTPTLAQLNDLKADVAILNQLHNDDVTSLTQLHNDDVARLDKLLNDYSEMYKSLQWLIGVVNGHRSGQELIWNGYNNNITVDLGADYYSNENGLYVLYQYGDTHGSFFLPNILSKNGTFNYTVERLANNGGGLFQICLNFSVSSTSVTVTHAVFKLGDFYSENGNLITVPEGTWAQKNHLYVTHIYRI